MAPLVFVINGLTKGNWLEALLFAVAVAVGLTPEMLPMIVTVNLAKGAMAMSKKKVIVKRLNAIQNFGAMDVLCTDKTGTLTQDRVVLKRHLDLQGKDSDRVLEYAYLNSFHQSGLKNLLDVAVLKHVELDEKLKIDEQFSKIDEIPFDFERRRMSVVLKRGDDAHILICKGAVEEVFAVCKSYAIDGETGALDESHFAQAKETTAKLNADGFRVIAVAFKEMPPAQAAYSVADEAGLTLLGYIAFLDPPKETAAAAIATLKARGVQVKILTGDNDIVTRKICNDVSLPVDHIVLGHEMETLSPDQLADLAETATVFAKVSPAQKAAIIDALHRKGHVVGYLGDGINDGPALKAADVGISVDSAVDIAKDSADIILLEKSLAVLGDGVIEGRKVFGNITKYIKMGASSNFGNMFSVLGASIFLPFLPMTAIQVLTNNLLYDFSQTTIPTDNVDAEYLAVPRRWDIGNITKFVLLIGPDQLDLRLRHVFHDALCLQRVDQSCTVPDRLVRRISAHPDAHHPYHSHGEDPVPGKPSQHRTHHDDHHHCRNRDNPTVLLAWRLPGLRPATSDLLDSALSYPPELCRPDAFHEDMVHSTVRVELNAVAWNIADFQGLRLAVRLE